MFAAHTSIGYLSTKLALKYSSHQEMRNKAYFFGVLGSVFPDIDLFWFYSLGQRAVHHHNYITHKPLAWLLIIIPVITYLLVKKSKWSIVAICFFGNVMLHIITDTIVGNIHWLWPFVKGGTTLVAVTTRHDFWVYNFLDHWTFNIEIGIILFTLYILIKSISKSSIDSKI